MFIFSSRLSLPIQSQVLQCLVFSFFITNIFGAQFKGVILKSAEAFQPLFISGAKLLKVRLHLFVGVLIQSVPLNEMLAPVGCFYLRVYSQCGDRSTQNTPVVDVIKSAEQLH